LLDAVRGAAKRQGVPYQRFIRTAVESALDRETRKWAPVFNHQSLPTPARFR
jgi:hypothetical protein